MSNWLHLLSWIHSAKNARNLVAQLPGPTKKWVNLALNAQSMAVSEDQAKALAGVPSAQCELAERFYDGRGVPQDYAQAAEWFRQAAEHGYPSAQRNLGMLYYLGRGISRDPVEAAKWLQLAATNGDLPARKALETVLQKLSPDQLDEAHQRAAAFRPVPFPAITPNPSNP